MWKLKVVGVILTGGMSRRFGSPKAFAKYGDQMFYEIAAQRLAPFVDKIVISTSLELLPRWKEIEDISPVEIVTDVEKFAGEGPLSGIYSTIAVVEADYYLVLPCDMPFIGTEILIELVNNGTSEDVISFQSQDRKHPLVGLYSRSNFEQLSIFLEQGNRRVMDYLDIVKTSWITIEPEDEWMFQNINQPGNLQEV